MKRSYFLIAFLIILGLGFWYWHSRHSTVNIAVKPVLVTVTNPTYKTIPLTVKALGQVIAPETIMLKTQTDGTVLGIYFKSGQAVTKGQLLLQLDPTVAKAAVDQQYANYINLQTQYNRYLQLSKLDNSAVSADMLSQKQNLTQAAKAQWQAAEQQLSYTQVKAPFDGTVGVPEQILNQVATAGSSLEEPVQLNIGTYLPAGSPIAILSNPAHMFVQYQVAQDYSSQLKVGQAISIKISAFPKKIFHGVVKYISPIVYQSNQAIEVIASITDPNPLMRSGMNASISQIVDPNQRALTIPGLSLVPSLAGYSVYTVEDSKVNAVPVIIGQRYNDLVAIKSGLTVGDQVITSGALIVSPGMKVEIKR